MDLIFPNDAAKLQEQNVSALLTLPRSDLNIVKHGEEEEEAQQGAVELKRYLLMQLPKGIGLTDLASGSRFVAPTKNKKTSDNINNTQDKVALVVESKNQSFLLSRLETSNVLVLVPPQEQALASEQGDAESSASKENSNSNNATKEDSNDNDDGPAAKKAKLNTSSLIPVAARLLTPGVASGSSFLELRPRIVRPTEVASLLKPHVFDPYNKNPYAAHQNNTSIKKGRTVESLALELQCSQGQVTDVLTRIHSFPFPHDTATTDNPIRRYGILSEEALCDAQSAIIATLAEEAYRFGNYDTNDGVGVAEFVGCAKERLDQTYPEMEHVLKHVMTRLVGLDSKEEGKITENVVTAERVCFNVQKIAIAIAHRLFQSQPKTPWEHDKLLLKWQSELPGVGSSRYTVKWNMLRGVAISMTMNMNSGDDNDDMDDTTTTAKQVWHYLPAEQLPLDPAKRFHALFDIQPQWTTEDLEPYLDALLSLESANTVEATKTKTALLLQYTTTSTTQEGVKVYTAKV